MGMIGKERVAVLCRGGLVNRAGRVEPLDDDRLERPDQDNLAFPGSFAILDHTSMLTGVSTKL